MEKETPLWKYHQQTEKKILNANGKGLPTVKFTTVFRDIPGAMSDDKVY